MAEGEHVDPAYRPQHLDRLLTDFTGRTPDVMCALVVSCDGFLVAASGRPEHGQPDKLAAITSGLIGLARAAAEVSDRGAFTQALVVMERGTVVIMAIDDGSGLAVLTTAAADLDQVGYEMTLLAERAHGILTRPARGAAADPDGRGPRAGLPAGLIAAFGGATGRAGFPEVRAAAPA